MSRAGQSSPGSAVQTARAGCALGQRGRAAPRRPGSGAKPAGSGRPGQRVGGRRRPLLRRAPAAVAAPAAGRRSACPRTGRRRRRASRATCGVSTGSPDGTCDSGSSRPVKSVASSSETTNPSSSWPLNRTRTRQPALHGVGELVGHRVVERPVQVRQAARRRRPGPPAQRVRLEPSPAGRRRCRDGGRATLPKAADIPGAVPGRPIAQAGFRRPTAARSASTRSVRSQGSSTSVRPKCP